MRPRRDAVVAAALASLALGPHMAGAQQPNTAGASGAVHGIVYDSLAHRPLAGAIVQSVGAGDGARVRSVITDSAGQFRIDSLAPGRYLVGFFHPLLDLLSVAATPGVAELGPAGDTVRVDLGVPDLARVRPVVCGTPQSPTDSSALLTGFVRDATDGTTVANAKVVLTWTERSLGKKGVQVERRRVPVPTGPGGSYVVCGVPAGEEIVATATAPGRATGDVAFEVPPRGLMVRDLTLGDTVSVATTAAARPKAGDATATRLARGTARLAGTVRDSAGRAVHEAQVSLWGTDAAATVDPDGAFTLGGLPAGTRTLEVRAIGFAPRRIPVDLAAGRVGTVDVRLERVTPLAAMTVFGTPSGPLVSRKFAEFLDRQRQSVFGRFLTPEDIGRGHPIDVTDAFRGMAGLQIDRSDERGKTIVGRNGKGQSCFAVVVLDGMPIPPDDRIDHLVAPEQVAGIEVYVDPAYAPPQYLSGRRNGCSVVLIWTR